MSFLGIKNPFRTGSGAVKREAEQAATARQGRAANLTSFIDSIFADPRREQQTTSFMDALRTNLGDQTNRGFADVGRQTKFATARQGLTGGRVDVDRQRLNLEDLFKRRIGDEAQVQDAGNQLRTQDQATRQSLISGAYGTADVGQDAMRGLIGSQAKNAGYISSLLPGFVQDTGRGLAGAFSTRANVDAFRRGLGAPPKLGTPIIPAGGFSTGDF